MFTDADHAKAVELYRKFGTAKWWPRCVQRRFHDGLDAEHWHDGSEYDGWTHPQLALSAIAWAMVERLGDTDHWLDMDTGLWYVGFDKSNRGHTTRFLALVAAIESTHKEPQ